MTCLRSHSYLIPDSQDLSRPWMLGCLTLGVHFAGSSRSGHQGALRSASLPGRSPVVSTAHIQTSQGEKNHLGFSSSTQLSSL